MALIPSDPKQRNALLLGIVAIAAGYLFHSFWYSPREAEIAVLEDRLEQLEDRNRRARILATRGGEEIQERLAVFERHLTRLEGLIPQSEEVPRLLEAMAGEARRTGLGDLAAINPEPSEPGEFYTRRSYEVTVIGQYHDVGRFLTAVASLPRIITPVDLDLVARSPQAQRVAGSGDQEAGQVTARFRIQTYVLPTPPPELPPGNGANGTGGGIP